MKKRAAGMFYIIFLFVSAHSLMCMNIPINKQVVRLKLDDSENLYEIARWKVIQESNQSDILNIPGITEKEISHFDKELDTIDLQTIQDNKDTLKLEIKKKIILHHLPAYKAAFDYLLVSMIADNISHNRVNAEEAYVCESPASINKLKALNGKTPLSDKDTFPKFAVGINIPLSTMVCVGLSVPYDTCEVHVYDEDHGMFKDIGTVKYNAKNMNGLGITTDLRYLVATFDDKLVSKAELYSDDDYATYKDITNNIKLADIYLLLHLYKAKKEGLRAELQNNERDYIRDHVATSEKGKELIKKHFL